MVNVVIQHKLLVLDSVTVVLGHFPGSLGPLALVMLNKVRCPAHF